MGLSVSTLSNGLWGTKKYRILMVSLDAAGKTTILRKLKFGKDADIFGYVPTNGFNVETIKHKEVSFMIWEVSGGDKIRPLWRNNYKECHCQGIIFVVDSSDRDRIQEAQTEFLRMINSDECQNAVLLVYANKQDLPNAMTAQEIADKLKLPSIKQEWYIQASCATTGDGLYEGLEWLSQKLE